MTMKRKPRGIACWMLCLTLEPYREREGITPRPGHCPTVVAIEGRAAAVEVDLGIGAPVLRPDLQIVAGEHQGRALCDAAEEAPRQIVAERQIAELDKVRRLHEEVVLRGEHPREHFVRVGLGVHRLPRDARAVAPPILDVELIVAALVVEEAVHAEIAEDDEVVRQTDLARGHGWSAIDAHRIEDRLAA